jgi:hypothetical protein
MGMTLRQYMDGPLRWALYEKGLVHIWNQLNQIVNSEAGSGVTGGTTILGSIDITAATGLQKDGSATAKGLSGIFATGAESGTTAFKVPPMDPGGNVGPNPQRISERIPRAGFRDS